MSNELPENNGSRLEEDGVTDDICCDDLAITGNCPMETCFRAFDADRDDRLNLAEFEQLCRALFRNERGKPYALSETNLKDMYKVFDKDKDGFISSQEFEFCWQHWVKKIVKPTSGLLVVDVQNDFISGTLSISRCSAKHNGEEVVEPINKLIDTVKFEGFFYSLDWHPANHVSFIENIRQRKLHPSSEISAEKVKVYDTVVFEGPPINEQILWPRHCVQNSWGAELHKNLKIADNKVFIFKGTNADVDSYSAFWDNNKLSQTSLAKELEKRGITDVYIGGIATDVCVGATASHALEFGYRTILVEDACRGISLENIEKTKNQLKSENAVFVNSSQVKAMVEGRDRLPELGYKLAMELNRKGHDGSSNN